jgi:hypothetical protein
VARKAKSVRWTRQAFLRVLERLQPGSDPVLGERWVRWVKNYHKRRKTKNPPASTIYNRIEQPSWIAWLAEASGIDKASIRNAEKRAEKHRTNQAKTKEMRITLSWEKIAPLLERVSRGKRPGRHHTSLGPSDKTPTANEKERNSSGAAGDPYSRYVQTYEVEIAAAHNTLQKRFERFLISGGATELRPNVEGVDLRYQDAIEGTVLVEVKPCERANARYAIRTAIGQLLDYSQKANKRASLLIVVGVKPHEQDRLLATSNGFGIAHPAKSSFEILWSTSKERN